MNNTGNEELKEALIVEALTADEPVAAFFHSATCPVCKIQTSILNEIGPESDPAVKVVKVDVNQFPGVASRFCIISVPTVALMRKGEIVERTLGLASKDEIEGKIRQCFGVLR